MVWRRLEPPASGLPVHCSGMDRQSRGLIILPPFCCAISHWVFLLGNEYKWTRVHVEKINFRLFFRITKNAFVFYSRKNSGSAENRLRTSFLIVLDSNSILNCTIIRILNPFKMVCCLC